MTTTADVTRTVSEVMTTVATLHGPGATAADLRRFLLGDHVHLAVVTDGRRLVSTVSRDDLTDDLHDTTPATLIGRLAGRTVRPEASVAVVHARMVADGVRRLAVVDDRGDLLGLLCLKRRLHGFCSDTDIAEHRTGGPLRA